MKIINKRPNSEGFSNYFTQSANTTMFRTFSRGWTEQRHFAIFVAVQCWQLGFFRSLNMEWGVRDDD
jgi:hypothetical protein